MNTMVRSIGLAAIGAIAMTVIAAQEEAKVAGCALPETPVMDDCNFEVLLWDMVRDSGNETDLEDYLEMFPNGVHSIEAKRRLAKMLPRYGVLRFAPNSS